MLMYAWETVPAAPGREYGVSGDADRARELAAAVLLASPVAEAALVTEARADRSARYTPTGKSWTGLRDGDGGVGWTQAEAPAAVA
jgi:hypothetical protein